MITWMLLPWLAHASPEDTAATLRERALASDLAWERLEVLCDDIGHRLSGSPALDRAIAWGRDAMRADGLVNVAAEPVSVPRWVRGAERAEVVAPHAHPLTILGLGNTVPTPEGGLEAEVLRVTSFDDLEMQRDAARGRIVLFDVPFTTYGAVSPYRMRGPAAAARLGAVAALVRSVGPGGHKAVQTGTHLWPDDVTPIPAAAIAAEDAMRIARWQARGLPVRMRLALASTIEPDVESANVVGEIRGRTHPDEVVVLACHLDSWDVGQGAEDDGVGCAMALEAGRLLATLETPPARTVRVVLFTNEENGLRGAFTYADRHAGERHVAGIEADTGSAPARGFQFDLKGASDEATARALAALGDHIAPAAPLLAPLGAATFAPGFGGVDLIPLARRGVPTFALDNATDAYWTVHHSVADTLDKVDRDALRTNAAAMATLAWWLSEHPPAVLESDDQGRAETR